MGGIRSRARLAIAGTSLFAAVAWAQTSPTVVQSPHHDIGWDARGGAALRTQVPAGKFTEWCGTLRLGEDIHWEFESADPLDVNVHYHEGKDVQYPVQHDAVTVWSGQLAPTADRSYCWMWTNKGGAPVALQARLQKISRSR